MFAISVGVAYIDLRAARAVWVLVFPVQGAIRRIAVSRARIGPPPAAE